MTSGILPFALRARLRRFKIAPGDFVSPLAGVAARADQRQKLERLYRYVRRPAIPGATAQAGVTPGILPSALRASLRLLRIAPGDLVGIDIETCPACGGAMRIIACIEDPEVIEKSLTHLDAKGAESEATSRPPSRAPPQRGLFDKAGRATPICTRMGERARPADASCRRRSGETNRCELPKRWFMLPIPNRGAGTGMEK